jgi:hypothetical protein
VANRSDRQYSGKKENVKNKNDGSQSTTQKTKDWVTHNALNIGGRRYRKYNRVLLAPLGVKTGKGTHFNRTYEDIKISAQDEFLK